MNKEQMEGKSEQLKAEFKKTWARLTDDDILLYEANQDKFFGVLKEKYGIAKEEAEKTIKEHEKACGMCSTDQAA